LTLIKCKECGHTVSAFAKTCPNCGYKYPNVSPPTNALIAVLVITAIAAYVIFWSGDHGGVTEQPPQKQHEHAGAPTKSLYVDEDVEAGHKIHLEIMSRYPDVEPDHKLPMLVGVGTRSPKSAILVPVDGWEGLTGEQKGQLSAYAASTVAEVKSKPFKYAGIPETAPAAPTIKRNVSKMTRNSWAIIVGPIAPSGRTIVMDKTVRSGSVLD